MPAQFIEGVPGCVQKSAAICRNHKWDAASVIGHKEWQPGKVDPKGFTMSGLSQRTGVLLAGKPGGGSSTYTVRDGDTLSGIGQALGVSWQALAKANSISAPYVIHPGQKLVVQK